MKKVYKLTAQIPLGKVLTYGRLAQMVDCPSARTIGWILHRNPDPVRIPCHRVVNAQGKLASHFAFGGIAGQAQKLCQEGVIVQKNRVDLKQYLWLQDKI